MKTLTLTLSTIITLKAFCEKEGPAGNAQYILDLIPNQQAVELIKTQREYITVQVMNPTVVKWFEKRF